MLIILVFYGLVFTGTIHYSAYQFTLSAHFFCFLSTYLSLLQNNNILPRHNLPVCALLFLFSVSIYTFRGIFLVSAAKFEYSAAFLTPLASYFTLLRHGLPLPRLNLPLPRHAWPLPRLSNQLFIRIKG